MDIPIEIPGLNQFIPSVPGGSVVLVRGGNDYAKTFFAEYLGEQGRRAGMRLVFVTSRGKEEVTAHYRRNFNDGVGIEFLEDRSPLWWSVLVREDVVMVIDSFSYFMLDKDSQSFRATLEEMRMASRKAKAIVVLTLDSGMLPPEREAVLLHLVDGVIDFHVKETGEGIVRFIRISRWMDGCTYDSNIFYTFEDMRLNVDLRNRVV